MLFGEVVLSACTQVSTETGDCELCQLRSLNRVFSRGGFPEALLGRDTSWFCCSVKKGEGALGDGS